MGPGAWSCPVNEDAWSGSMCRSVVPRRTLNKVTGRSSWPTSKRATKGASPGRGAATACAVAVAGFEMRIR
jgi:hypothetical protein